MGTLNIKVDGTGAFYYQVAPEADFTLEPIEENARARLTEYIQQK